MKALGYSTMKFEYRITIHYLIFGILWILFSDNIIELIQSDFQIKMHLQTYKGIFFIIITAALLFIFIRGHMRKLRIAEAEIQKLNEELEHKVAERAIELTNTNHKLQELNTTKDKFFSIIGHDLRNPFNNIISLSKMLDSGTVMNKPEFLQKNIQVIQRSAENAYNLLDNLLNWARSQTGIMSFHHEKIPLQLIINNAFEATMTMAQKKQITITIIAGENHMVMADANMINTVLRNMMTNAIKFTAAGGNITLQTEIVQNKARILVKDDGIGIESQRIANLFNITERNSQPGTNNEPGTGLGLILCKEFIEKHGEDIMIESIENKGSVFSFTLPLVLNEN